MAFGSVAFSGPHTNRDLGFSVKAPGETNFKFPGPSCHSRRLPVSKSPGRSILTFPMPIEQGGGVVFNPFSEVADSGPTDAELVEQARNGDRPALEQLVLRHQAWVYNI